MSEPIAARHSKGAKTASAFILASAIALAMLWISLTPTAATAQQGGAFLGEEDPPPTGANNPDCKVDREHPNPIILVPGTFENMADNWKVLSPLLVERGYCVYSLNYGESGQSRVPATGRIQQSAEELKVFTNLVLKHTGAEKVSMVGHSQGGMMPRYYIKFLGGAKKVEDLVGLVPSNHGTKGVIVPSEDEERSAAGEPAVRCVACTQQGFGSVFLKKLNRGDETPGPVDYTIVTTVNDEIVTPYTSAYIKGPDSQRRNILVQNYYKNNNIDHHLMPQDPQSLNFVFDALAFDGPANPKRAVKNGEPL